MSEREEAIKIAKAIGRGRSCTWEEVLKIGAALLASEARSSESSRPLILEEAAKVADEFAETHRKPPHHNDTFWAATNLAKAIRSLSHDGKAPAPEGAKARNRKKRLRLSDAKYGVVI